MSEAEYETETVPGNENIVAYKKIHENQQPAIIDSDTIFSVFEERTGRTFYLKNVVSSVYITGTQFNFRNIPHFMSLIPTEAERRDALHETEAVLDDYFFHPNTAPFIARLFIQRFNVASNPAPAYVKAVAKSFSEGLFTHGSQTVGSGEYGCLAATVAAVLLHPEANSPSLDNDPSFGSIRQPLLRVLGLIRNYGKS